jgi:HSP20 family protein
MPQLFTVIDVIYLRKIPHSVPRLTNIHSELFSVFREKTTGLSEFFSGFFELAFCLMIGIIKKEVNMTTALSKMQNGNSVPRVGNLVNGLFHDSLQRIFEDNFWNDAPMSTGSVPVNVRETEKQYQIDIVAPGCRKEDFKISINEKLLTVTFSPEKTIDSTDKVSWTRNEYVQLSFSKTFVVDESVDVSNIGATYQDGILRISLAKKQQAKSSAKQIEIK